MVLTLSPVNSSIAIHETSRDSDTSSNPDETARNFDGSFWISESGLDGPTVENTMVPTLSPMNTPIAGRETSWEPVENVSNPGDASPTPESGGGTNLNPLGVSSMTVSCLFGGLYTDGRSWVLPLDGDSYDPVE